MPDTISKMVGGGCRARCILVAIFALTHGTANFRLTCITDCFILLELHMPGARWTPGAVPYGADQTMYLVIDCFPTRGSICRETEIERTDLEVLIADLIAGQFNDPIRVVAFNTLEHWSKDVSSEIADEIQTRCDFEGVNVPEHVRDFVVPALVQRARFRLWQA